MQNSAPAPAAQHFEVGAQLIPEARKKAGRALIVATSIGLAAIILLQGLYTAGFTSLGFENWRPALYAFILWSVALGVGQVMIRGE